MIFTDYLLVVVLNLSVMGNMVFFYPKVDRKRIFTWSFLAFHHTPELRKYSFSYSVSYIANIRLRTFISSFFMASMVFGGKFLSTAVIKSLSNA